MDRFFYKVEVFQTPSAGRWVLQLLFVLLFVIVKGEMFQTPSAGRWVLQLRAMLEHQSVMAKFQTPSAGRWVLQLRGGRRGYGHCRGVSNPISGEVGAAATRPTSKSSPLAASFKPHQRGGGCCSPRPGQGPRRGEEAVSNPISGEVGAAAQQHAPWSGHRQQHVSNPISGEVGAAAYKEQSQHFALY